MYAALFSAARAGDFDLESRLKSEVPAVLATAARQEGDAYRGAIVFHPPQTTCTKCHSVDGTEIGLGPDLTALPREMTDESLVESLLDPSKSIRKGFELVTVATLDGRSISGLVVENNAERLVLRESATPGKTIAVTRHEIEKLVTNTTSAMPAGIMNQLASRQQFLDLVRYLLELRDGGKARAVALMQPAALYALQIPEYESHVDHVGMIRALDTAAYNRGQAIYERLCVNCHGTRDQAGSLPTSLRFAEGKFKRAATHSRCTRC